MKILLTLLFILINYFSQAQTFNVTQPEPLIIEEVNGHYHVTNYLQTISLIMNGTDTILNHNINVDTEEFQSEISRFNPSISNVSEVVKVDFIMTACLTSIETYYFIIDYNGDVFKFGPVLSTTFDVDLLEYDLIFPEDSYGLVDQIYLGQINYRKDLSVSHVVPICHISKDSFSRI